jgi:hypothetical protein
MMEFRLADRVGKRAILAGKMTLPMHARAVAERVRVVRGEG